MGALVGTMVEWLAQDQDYQRMFRQMGLDAALSTLGFLAVLASMFGLAIAVQVAWRVGAARAEEESGRAEAVLAHPVSGSAGSAGTSPSPQPAACCSRSCPAQRCGSAVWRPAWTR